MFRKHAATHRCFCPECTKEIPNNKLLCVDHWRMLPRWQRDKVVECWKYGLANRCHPTANYIDAVRTAQAFLRDKLHMAQANSPLLAGGAA